MSLSLRGDRRGQPGHFGTRSFFGVQRCDVGGECPLATLRLGLEEELPPRRDEVRRLAPRIECLGSTAGGEHVGGVICRKHLTVLRSLRTWSSRYVDAASFASPAPDSQRL